MRVQSQSIVLKRVAYGDSDLIVTFFSREFGRLTGIAKSARSSMRRFGGALEIGSIIDVIFSEKSGAELVRLEEARLTSSNHGITRSLEKIGALARAVDIALAFLQERHPAPEKFDLLRAYIVGLSNSELPTPNSQLRTPNHEEIKFMLEWLKLAGFEMHLKSCVSCGREISGKGLALDPVQGGVVCVVCSRSGNRNAIHNTTGVAGLLNIMIGSEISQTEQIEALSLIESYVHNVIGKPLRTAGTNSSIYQ